MEPSLHQMSASEQNLLSTKRVAIVGVGTIGTAAARLLARTGIGTFTLIDHDIVEETNLRRQTLYDERDIAKPKCLVAAEKLQQINEAAKIIPIPINLTAENVHLVNADLVLDCTDNLETRFIIGEYCKRMRIPWVHAAAAGSIGAVLPITDTYCFNCIYRNAKHGVTCEDGAISIAAAWFAASLQVTEALRILLGNMHTQALIRFDLSQNSFDVFNVRQNPSCRLCYPQKTPDSQKNHGKTNTIEFTVSKCKTRAAYSAKPTKNIKLSLNLIKQKFTTLIDTPIALVIKANDIKIVVHNYGELLFRNFSDEAKIKQIAEAIYAIGSENSRKD